MKACSILVRTKPPQCTLSLAELRAVKELKRDELIVILPTDRGSATVVMNTMDYQRKIRERLELGTYRKLLKDPMASEVNVAVWCSEPLKWSYGISNKLCRQMNIQLGR